MNASHIGRQGVTGIPDPYPTAPSDMSPMCWAAQFLGNHDGDTITVLAKGPWYGRMELTVRVRGIQAAEVKPRAKTVAEDSAGQRVRVAAREFCDGHPLLIRTVKPDAYNGRFDADVFVIRADGVAYVQESVIDKTHALVKGITYSASLAQYLLSLRSTTLQGCLVPYDGKGKAPAWPFAEDS